ncbi:hypothetical protein Tco_0965883 [Tanacetum coccineum]
MTRSSTKELFTPFKDLEREIRSSRKLFKTLSLDESRSLMFDLFSDLEENSEEEVSETMGETMEEYMSKTQVNYGSGVTRPKIDDKDHFELKDQFLKELRDNTFSGSDHEDTNEHIEKVLEIIRNKPSGSIKTREDLKAKFLRKYCPLARTAKKMEEINNFQQEPDETLYQAWERFKELLMKFPQHYLTEMQEPSKRWPNILKNGTTKHLGQKVLRLLTDWLPSKYNLIILEEKSRRWDVSNVKDLTTPKTVQSKKKEIRSFTDAAIRNQGASIKTLEIQIGQMSKVLQVRGFGSFPSSTKINLRDHVKSISTTVEADMTPIRCIGSSQYTVLAKHNRASVSVMPVSTYLNLGLGKLAHTKLTVELVDRIVKHSKGIAENVLVGIVSANAVNRSIGTELPLPGSGTYMASGRISFEELRVIMSTSTHPIIVLSDSYIEDAFSSTTTPDYTPASPDYFPASPGNASSDSSEDLSKDLLVSLTISPFHNDPYIKVMQAYNATSNELTIPLSQAPIAPPTVLPPSPVLPSSPLFDSRGDFSTLETSLMAPKRTSTSAALAMT